MEKIEVIAGYGVCLDNLHILDAARIRDFINAHCSTNLKNIVFSLPSDYMADDVMDAISECYGCERAQLLADAVRNETGIEMIYTIDEDNLSEYCLLPPSFPWSNVPERNQTKESFDMILLDLLRELTDDVPHLDYYESRYYIDRV